MGKTKNIIQFKLILIEVLILLVFPAVTVQIQAKGKERKDETVDYLALCALLIKDGFYDRAGDTLNAYDTSAENADMPRYYTLSGLIYLKKNLFVEAEERFLSAVKNGQTEPVIWIYIAQARYGNRNYKGTVEAVEKAGSSADSMPAVISLTAESYWKLKETEKAWNVLKKGLKFHPEYGNFLRQQYFYLIELGLYRQAVEAGNQYLRKHKAGAEDYLALGMALRQVKMYEESISFLEEGRLVFPKDEKILAELGRAWLESGHTLAAALLFDQASNSDPKYIADAAELYRRAKKLYRALILNTRITDQKEKLRQKMAIWLEMEEYELVAGMADDLQRTGLLTSDNMIYALAYSFFRTGNFVTAEKYLKKISTSEYFSKAAELRREMEKCSGEGSLCN